MSDRCATQLESASRRLVASFGRKWTQHGARSGWTPAVTWPGLQKLGQLLGLICTRCRIYNIYILAQIYIYTYEYATLSRHLNLPPLGARDSMERRSARAERGGVCDCTYHVQPGTGTGAASRCVHGTHVARRGQVHLHAHGGTGAGGRRAAKDRDGRRVART